MICKNTKILKTAQEFWNIFLNIIINSGRMIIFAKFASLKERKTTILHMKAERIKTRTILLLILLMAARGGKAQTILEKEHQWEDLPLENTAWVHFYQSLMVDSTYFQIGIKGDTIVNGESYKKVFNCSHLGFPIEGECFGGIRQDNDKYYFISLFSEYDYIPWPLELNVLQNTEYIIYDFSLSECDRFPTVGDVDPEFVFLKEDMEINGNMKQVFWFDYNDCETGTHNYDYHWIEGIGSNYGLLFSLQLGVWNGSCYNLVEILQDGESVYLAPEFAEIDYTSTKEAYGKKVSLYPNPTSGIVHIEGAEATEVQVFNTIGQCVKILQNTSEVSLEGLQQGIYLLRVATAGGKVFSDKVVKE